MQVISRLLGKSLCSSSRRSLCKSLWRSLCRLLCKSLYKSGHYASYNASRSLLCGQGLVDPKYITTIWNSSWLYYYKLYHPTNQLVIKIDLQGIMQVIVQVIMQNFAQFLKASLIQTMSTQLSNVVKALTWSSIFCLICQIFNLTWNTLTPISVTENANLDE